MGWPIAGARGWVSGENQRCGVGAVEQSGAGPWDALVPVVFVGCVVWVVESFFDVVGVDGEGCAYLADYGRHSVVVVFFGAAPVVEVVYVPGGLAGFGFSVQVSVGGGGVGLAEFEAAA